MQYIIGTGDTLSALAKRYGVSVDAIMAVNPQIKNKDKIIAGKVLNIPYSNISTASANGSRSILQKIGDALLGRK